MGWREELLNGLQAASNAVAGNVSGPVDLLNLGLGKLGLPVSDAPVGGSAWMARQGFTRPVKPGASQVVGETMGLLGPTLTAAYAPQIARGLLAVDNPMPAGSAGARMPANQVGAIGSTKVYHGSPTGPIVGSPRLSPHDETGIPGFSVSRSKGYAQSYANDVLGRHWEVDNPNPYVSEFDLKGRVAEYGKFMERVRRHYKTEMPSYQQIIDYAKKRGVVGVDHSKNLGIDEISVLLPESLLQK